MSDTGVSPLSTQILCFNPANRKKNKLHSIQTKIEKTVDMDVFPKEILGESQAQYDAVVNALLILTKHHNFCKGILDEYMVTSIFNHGMTNKIIQYIDRLTIMLTAVVYCVYVYSLETIWMLISVCYILLASSLYFLTKLSDQSIYHMIAHFIVIPLFFIIHVYRPQNKINYF
jgi:hypothetical protein